MLEQRSFDILDLVLYAVRNVRMLATIFVVTFVLSYGIIYFVIDAKYEASATIIPSQDDATSLGGMLKGLKGLPISLGKNAAGNSDISKFNTIIFSRTMMEELIVKFDLYRVYDIDTTDVDFREEALKMLKKDIVTNETKDDAYEIVVRAKTPQLAAMMVNDIVQRLNDKVVQLNIAKSKENRVFLEKRLIEIKRDLELSEDSLRKFQESSGVIDIKSQLPAMVTLYSNHEADLMEKQLKKSVLENLYDKQSTEVRTLSIEVREYEKKLNAMRQNGEQGGLVLATRSLPKKAVEYLRRYRQVEINGTILEFIIPLYEQAKIEEKKDYPVLQIIDQGVPPAKKSWPPRSLFAFLTALFVVLGYIVIEYVISAVNRSTDEKLHLIMSELSTVFRIRRG